MHGQPPHNIMLLNVLIMDITNSYKHMTPEDTVPEIECVYILRTSEFVIIIIIITKTRQTNGND